MTSQLREPFPPGFPGASANPRSHRLLVHGIHYVLRKQLLFLPENRKAGIIQEKKEKKKRVVESNMTRPLSFHLPLASSIPVPTLFWGPVCLNIHKELFFQPPSSAILWQPPPQGFQ